MRVPDRGERPAIAYVDRHDEQALAYLVAQEGRDLLGTMLRDDARVALVQERARGVRTDESETAYDEYHARTMQPRAPERLEESDVPPAWVRQGREMVGRELRGRPRGASR